MNLIPAEYIQIMKHFALILSFATVVTVAYSQKTEKTKGLPNMPGTIQLDYGFNRLTERPNNVRIGFWGSRTLNVYYLYDIRLGDSKFSVHPGIGFGFDRYKFINFRKSYRVNGRDTTVARSTPTLVIDNNGNSRFEQAALSVYDAPDSLRAVRKSMLTTTYLDIPLEFRFSTNPYDPARSFKVAIGGRVGFLVNAHTKIKYADDGENKKIKDNQNFNLTPIRYSATLRMGVGNFSWFVHYNLNPLFEKDKGPARTEAGTYTIGISLAGF